MGETARLRAVAIDRDRLAAQRLADKTRHDHPVLPRLPRADRVEEAADRHRKLRLHPVGQREEFVHRLRAGVAPAAAACRAHHGIVVFAERDLAAFAVDFRRGGQKERAAIARAAFQHDFRAADDAFDRPHRLVDDEPHADGAGQMIDAVRFANTVVDDVAVVDGIHDQPQLAAVLQTVQILVGAGR